MRPATARTPLLAPALLLPLLACSPPASPTGPSSAPVLVPSASATSTPPELPTPADSASAAPAAPARKPLPKAPPGVDAESFEVLASICGVAMWVRPDESILVGCRSKPPFQGRGETPDGEVQIKTDPNSVCFLSDFYKGSFSKQGAEQYILGLEACGDDRVNDIAPGNVILVERKADGYELVTSVLGLNVRKCHPAKRTDRTLLVCGDNMGAYGDGSLSWSFTLDFTKPAKQRVNVFSKLYRSAGVSCMGTDIVAERGITDFEERKREDIDFDKDGIEDLRISIERAHINGSDALAKKAELACQKSGGMSLEAKSLLGQYKRYTLEFRGQADTLVPTPATAKLLEQWSQTAPAFWWNVVK